MRVLVGVAEIELQLADMFNCIQREGSILAGCNQRDM